MKNISYKMNEDFKKDIMKTGTSLVGIVCKDGIVMASDRRATVGGNVIAEKNTKKTEKINEYLLLSMAGTVSDAQINSKVIAAQLRLKQLTDKKRPSVKEAVNYIAMMKFQNLRKPSMLPSIVGNLIAGVNEDGSTELYNISPDGALMKISDYDASGSGMQYIWGFLERNYKKGVSIEEGIELAIESIKSSSSRDAASGNGVDVFTVTKDGINQVSSQTVEYLYNEDKE